MTATVREADGILRIIIPLRRYRVVIVVLVAALLFYAGIVGARLLGLGLARYGGIWLLLDTLAPLALLLLGLWLASLFFSREEIVVDRRGLRHRYYLGPMPMSVTTTFALDQIHNLRPLADPVGVAGVGSRVTIFGASGEPGHGTIAFEYFGTRYRLGSSLDEREALHVIELIEARAPDVHPRRPS